MSDLYDVPSADTAFVPTADDVAGIEAWFARYDGLAAAGDVEAMADMAFFPLNVVSDTPSGDGGAAQWSRARFVGTMSQVLGSGGDVKLESTRTPHFLSRGLVVVVTDATMTAPGVPPRAMRYADLLLRHDGRWMFQTMVQSGWGDSL